MVEHIYTYSDPPSRKDIEKTCRVLSNGGVIAYPTDVNWAFGCDAANVKAMERLRKLKPHHPPGQPYSLICSSLSMASEYAYIDQPIYRIIRKVLPGPYTIILPAHLSLPRSFKDKRKTIGLRIPESPLLCALVDAYGKPLVSSSISTGRTTEDETDRLRFGYEVRENFGYLLDLILDLSEEVGIADTTVVDLTTLPPVLIRQGIGEWTPFKV